MLVLSRNRSESILVGTPPHQIRFMITNVIGGRVQVGIDANKEVPILREELASEADRQWPLGMPLRRESKQGGKHGA